MTGSANSQLSPPIVERPNHYLGRLKTHLGLNVKSGHSWRLSSDVMLLGEKIEGLGGYFDTNFIP